MDINRPAKFLVGQNLKDGWIVTQNITKHYGASANGFSESYLVEKGDKTVLMKALDFSVALLSPEPTEALSLFSRCYNFEKELLNFCNSEKMSRIVKIIDQGNISALPGSIISVPYFILEHADGGDLRAKLDFSSYLDIVWLLRILHNVSAGLSQLHRKGIAHKNLKPEFILQFSEDLLKLSELSNSDRKGIENPVHGNIDDKDPSYMTPERLYGVKEVEWINSQAADIYNLGNLMFFLFTQTNLNAMLNLRLDESHLWYNWNGTFEQVLPYLIEAHDEAINQFMAYIEIEEIQEELEGVLRQLSNPDYTKRGHPKTLGSTDPFSIDRYVNIFNRLAAKAELKLAQKSKV